MVVFIGGGAPLTFKQRTPFQSESVNPFECGAEKGDLVVIFGASFNVGSYGTGPTVPDWVSLFNNPPFLLTGGGARVACQGIMKRVQGSDDDDLQLQEAGLQAYLGEVLVFSGGAREPIDAGVLNPAPTVIWCCAFGVAPMTVGVSPSSPPMDGVFSQTAVGGARGLIVDFKLFRETDVPVTYVFTPNFSTAGGPFDGGSSFGYIQA